MALKLSTGLKNGILNGEDIKTLLNDGVIYVYSGSAPSSADDVPTGTQLLKITKDGGALTAGLTSTAQVDEVTVTAGSTNDTFTVQLGGADNFIYTQLAGDDATKILIGLAALLNADTSRRVIATVSRTGPELVITAKYPGEAVTIAVSKTGGGTITLTNKVSNARLNSLHLATAASGEITKAVETWSGVGLADGVAGYFRHVHNTDTGASSTTQCRIQGTCGSVGADLVMTSTTIATGSTNTVQTYKLRIA